MRQGDDVNAPVPSTAGLSPSQIRWVVAGLMMGLFLSSTEQSVVATALPTLAGSLGGTSRLAWVVSAYMLTSTISTPLYGKMSDLYGRRIVYQTAIVVFAIGSLLCGFADSMTQLVLARAVQGLGGGGLMSLAFVIIGDIVSPRQRGRYIGLFTGIFTVSAVMGPLWGGLLVDGPGWRWVFWSVVPLSLLSLAVANKGLALPFARRQSPIDWAGITTLIIAATGLILIPIWGGSTYPWLSWPVVGAAIVGIAGSAVFISVESRAVEPIIPLRMFTNPTIVFIYGMGFLLMASLLAVTTFLPLFLQVSTGVSATKSGLLLTPQSIGMSIVSALGGVAVSRWGRYKWALIAGPTCAIIALFGLTFLDKDTGPWDLAPLLFLLGIGLGMIFPNLTLAVQNTADMADLGIATSTSNFFRNMGGAFGAAVAGAFFANRLEQSLTESLGADQLDALGGVSQLIQEPKVVHGFPDIHRLAIVEGISDAVGAIFWWSIPFMTLVLLCALGVKELPLRTSSAVGGTDQAARPRTAT